MKKFIQNPYGAQICALIFGTLTFIFVFFSTKDESLSFLATLFAICFLWGFLNVPNVAVCAMFAIPPALSLAPLYDKFFSAVVTYYVMFGVVATLAVIAALTLVYDDDSEYKNLKREIKFYIFIGRSVCFFPIPAFAYWLATLVLQAN